MKRLTTVAVGVTLVISSSCTNGEEDLSARASVLAHNIIIIDTHIDVPYRLNRKWEDVSKRTASGDFDYVRAREGGLDALFMSIYTPAAAERQGRSKALADSLIDMVERIASDHPEKFTIAVSPDDVKRNFERGIVSFCIGMENGSPIEGKLANVEYFHDRGVRYITLTHSEDNHICDSSYDTTRTWHGLTDFGREVIDEMNRVGIMIDISHVSDDAFWQVMEITQAPVIASHSSCRHFLPGFERNISDDMIRRVAAAGGVVQINFGSTFITQEAREWMDAYKKVRDPHYAEHNIERDTPADSAYLDAYRKSHPFPFADVLDVADHIDHVVGLVGIDHVGFGSDFDGVGFTLPTRLKYVSAYPRLIEQLLERGYSEEDIARIAWGNVERVWRRVEAVAAAATYPAAADSASGK